jgi:hypothetical protein
MTTFCSMSTVSCIPMRWRRRLSKFVLAIMLRSCSNALLPSLADGSYPDSDCIGTEADGREREREWSAALLCDDSPSGVTSMKGSISAGVGVNWTRESIHHIHASMPSRTLASGSTRPTGSSPLGSTEAQQWLAFAVVDLQAIFSPVHRATRRLVHTVMAPPSHCLTHLTE